MKTLWFLSNMLTTRGWTSTCERPMFTLEVGVGPSFWDATYFVGEVMVSGKYYKAWGKKRLTYVMLNDNPMGYAYSHLICYVKFPMRMLHTMLKAIHKCLLYQRIP